MNQPEGINDPAYPWNADQWQQLTQQAQLMLIALVQGKLMGETVLTFSFEKLPEQLLALKYRSFSGKVVIEIDTNKEV